MACAPRTSLRAQKALAVVQVDHRLFGSRLTITNGHVAKFGGIENGGTQTITNGTISGNSSASGHVRTYESRPDPQRIRMHSSQNLHVK
jgi:hypothetical protein